MKQLISILFVLLVSLLASAQQRTRQISMRRPSYDEGRYCRAYSVLNQRMSCGPDNYLVRFGQRYCFAYLNSNQSFLPGTRIVLRNIRRCLVRSTILNTKLRCENTESEAMTAHLNCYMAAGFCDLPIKEQVKIWWLAKTETFQASFLETMYRVRAACAFGL